MPTLNKRAREDEPEEKVTKKAKVKMVASDEESDVLLEEEVAEAPVKNNFPVYRRSSVPDVDEEEKGKLSTIAKAETKGFKGYSFNLLLVGIPSYYPATDFQCGMCKEALESSWEDGVMKCRGKYANGARLNKHSNIAESFAQRPMKRRHCARGQWSLFVFGC